MDLMGGEFALRTSQIALANTSNPDIINFANEEIAEQTQVASMLWATPGTAPLRADHAALLARLQQTPRGRAFDAMYVRGQIRGHRELLALNTSFLQSGGDWNQQSVAQMSVPIIQRHLGILNSLREMA
jgi:putative membrane protein